DLFRYLLRAHGVEPIRDFDALELNPDQKVLFIFGNTQFLDGQSRIADIRRLIQAGLSVVIATDFPTSGWFRDSLGVAVSGTFLKAPLRSGLAYRGMLAECPMVGGRARPRLGRNDIFGGLEVA